MNIRAFLKKTGKWILIVFGGLVGLIAIVLLVIRLNSSGTAEPIVDEKGHVLAGSIAFIKDTVINGAPQRMTVRGKDTTNPILLRIHGGPGAPHAPQSFRNSNIDLEDLFTVCYWDQRGAGPAYSEDIPDSTITLEQIVEDGLDVSEYLTNRFGKEKIYIEGISWGTLVGAFMAQHRPDLFKAFIGVGLVANQPQSEQLSYDFVLKEAVEKNDTAAIRELKNIGRPPYETEEEMIEAVQVERSYVMKYAPSKVSSSTFEQLKLILLYEGWSIDFKYDVLTKGIFGKSAPILWPTNATANLMKDIPEWDIPVYIFQGSDDHFTETTVAKAYFDSLKAPVKEFYLFEKTGHFASAEHPTKYRSIIVDHILRPKEDDLNEEVKIQ